jgi:hypothetical protein
MGYEMVMIEGGDECKERKRGQMVRRCEVVK